MSKLSILGLYQHDQSLFENLHLPAEFTSEDRETLINNLLMECAEFECTYPAFDFCKAAIGFWSNARLHVWQWAKKWDVLMRKSFTGSWRQVLLVRLLQIRPPLAQKLPDARLKTARPAPWQQPVWWNFWAELRRRDLRRHPWHSRICWG